MNKINNKGFTLIELLAVVVLLLLISTIAISSINSAVERNKAKQQKAKYSVIASQAEAYYNSHKNSVQLTYSNDDNGYGEIDISLLNLSEDDLTDIDGNRMCGYVSVYKDNSGFIEFYFIENVGGCNHTINGTPYYGDADLSGNISSNDALYVLMYISGENNLTYQEQLNADANGDGKITYSDANCILKRVVGYGSGGGATPMVCSN